MDWLNNPITADFYHRGWFVGIVAVLAYLFILPVVLSRIGIFKKLYKDLGVARYYVFQFLFLAMMALPIKMVLRWAFNLKYIVAIQEYFFNI